MSPYSQTYEILSPLGKGGMSQVFLARHIRLGTLWALKQVDKSPGGHVDLLAEANILKRLSHPALPRIIDIFEDDKSIYIVEDYIEGVSLDRRLLEAGRIPEALVLKWAFELCDVLGYLHSQAPRPIIFRDMKPGNIMITHDGAAKLIDFGIAREYRKESGGDTTTLGTLGYAAPEQFGLSQSDERTDIYSLGVTLYHALTGKSPNEPPYELLPVRQWDARFSEGIEYILQKCTQADPQYRYQSIESLLADLRNIERFSSASKRRKLFDGLKLAGCALLIMGGVLAALAGNRLILADEAAAFAAEEAAWEAMYEQGQAMLDAGDLDGAEQALLEADAGTGGTRGHLAFIAALLSAGDMERCAAFAELSVQEYPQLDTDALVNYCWGAALDALEDAQGAREKFRKANEAEPGNTLYMRSLARASAAAGDIEEANALFQELSQSAEDQITSFVYAGILVAQGEQREAADEYRRCIGIASDDSIRIAAYRDLASLYRDMRSSDPSALNQEIETLSAMQRAYPTEEQAYVQERLGEAYFALGAQSEDSQAFRQSAGCFESLIALGYSRASTYLNLAIIRQRLGEYGEAEEALLALLDSYPGSADAYIQLAFLTAEREGKKAQSERDYTPILEYYNQAVQNGASGASLQRLEGMLSDLRGGGWLAGEGADS